MFAGADLPKRQHIQQCRPSARLGARTPDHTWMRSSLCCYRNRSNAQRDSGSAAAGQSPSRQCRSFMAENGQTFPAARCMMRRWNCPLTTPATAHSRRTMRASTGGFSLASRRGSAASDLPGARPATQELPLLSWRRRCAGCWLSPVPALQAGDLARYRGVARNLEHGLSRARTLAKVHSTAASHPYSCLPRGSAWASVT
jgi:hypothetical protein